jgi:hypothetical protein
MSDFEYGVATYSLVFGIGMIFQTFLLLAGRWEPGDLKKIIIITIFGLCAMIPGIIEPDYKLSELIFASFLLGAIAFVTLFKKKLLLQINSHILLIWNLLFITLVFLTLEQSLPLLLLIGIPFLYTLAGCFSSIDKSFVWQVCSYTWMSFILVLIGLYQFNFLAFGSLFSETANQVSIFDVFISGASFIYLFINVWFIVALIPIPRKHQTLRQRIIEIQDHMQLIASGYTSNKDKLVVNFFILTLLPLGFYLNHAYEVFTMNALIGVVFVLISIVGRYGYNKY